MLFVSRCSRTSLRAIEALQVDCGLVLRLPIETTRLIGHWGAVAYISSLPAKRIVALSAKTGGIIGL